MLPDAIKSGLLAIASSPIFVHFYPEQHQLALNLAQLHYDNIPPQQSENEQANIIDTLKSISHLDPIAIIQQQMQLISSSKSCSKFVSHIKDLESLVLGHASFMASFEEFEWTSVFEK